MVTRFLKTKTVNVELFYTIDVAQDPKANIVINHGFAEHLKRYDHITKRLKTAGYNVLRYDLRGHGQSKGPKGHIKSYSNFLEDANAMVDIINNKYPNLDTYMLGHSMGGLITTLYGINYPSKVKGQILSGAANGIIPNASSIKAKGLAFMAKVFPKMQLKNPVNKDLCSVEEVVEKYLNDPLVLKSASLNFYNEFLNQATKESLDKQSTYKLPVLILHGKKDTIVPSKISENFYNNIISKDKKLIIYPELYHEILNEINKDEIIDEIVNWLNTRIINNK